MTAKLSLFYQPNLVGMGGISFSEMETVGLVFYTVPYSFYRAALMLRTSFFSF